MRYLLSFFILLSIHLCNAQDEHLIRLVCYSGEVTLDGIPVKAGQLIFSSSNKLVVSRNASYAYVLTQKGYAMKLESGSYTVNKIEEFIYKERYKPKPITTGAVHRGPPFPLVFVGLDEFSSNLLLGDSIYLRWKKSAYGGRALDIKPPYHFRVYSMFEDLLSEIVSQENFVKMNLRLIAGDNNSVLIALNKKDCALLPIKFLPTEITTQILKDISDITTDQDQKEILDLVIYDSHNLVLDLMFNLDKIAQRETTSLQSDLRNYISSLKLKYEIN